MRNSELVTQVQEFEYILREAFKQCNAADITGMDSRYDFDKYELTNNGVEIVGYDYRCGGDYESFVIPYKDLDDISAFITRRKLEIEEEKKQKAQKVIDDAKKKEEEKSKQEYETYLKLKEKYGQ